MRISLIIGTFILSISLPLCALAQVGAEPDPAFANCKDEPGASAACNKAMRENCEAVAQCDLDPDPLVCAQSVKQVDLSTVCGDFSGGLGGTTEIRTPETPPPDPTPTPTPTPTQSPTSTPSPPPPPPTPSPTPTPTAPNTQPATGDASGDVNACVNDTNSAISACDVSQVNQFQSQVANQPTGGVGQMNGAQQINNVVNGCSNMQSRCLSTCSNSVQDAQAKCGDNCSSLLNQQISQINSYYSACQNLSGNLSTLQNAGNQALNQAAQQQQQNGMNPSSVNPYNPTAQLPPAASTAVNCLNPVNAAQCSVQPTQTAAQNTAGNNSNSQNAGPLPARMGSSSGFNVGNPGTQAQNPSFPNNNASQVSPQPPMMPYGGSSSGFDLGSGSSNQNSGASVPARRLSMTPGKTSTDILHGTQSVSGYSSAVSRSVASRGQIGKSMSGFSRLGKSGDLGRFRGLDLKQYLPGGARDGTRQMSGVNFAHPDIHSQNDDLWVQVSNRYRIHCKLQLLYDCQ